MDPLVHPRDQTVNFTRRRLSHRPFFEIHIHRLPGEGQNSHRAVLCRIIGPIRSRIAENTAPFAKKKVFFRRVKEVGASLGQVYRDKGDYLEKQIQNFRLQ